MAQSVARLEEILGEPVKVASVPRAATTRGWWRAPLLPPASKCCSTPSRRVGKIGRRLPGAGPLYVVMRGMGPEWAAGFAAGRIGPRWRQTALWKPSEWRRPGRRRLPEGAAGDAGPMKEPPGCCALLALCAAADGQPIPLNQRVLVIVEPPLARQRVRGARTMPKARHSGGATS